MSEKPILFSGEMVRAILEGRKTQTRRVIKLQPPNFATLQMYGEKPSCFYCWDGNMVEVKMTYQSGDILWVRETWARMFTESKPCESIHDLCPDCCFLPNAKTALQEQHPYIYVYKADSPTDKYPGEWPEEEGDNPECPRWKPSIHMPREAARLFLKVKNVRMERVQDITEEDADAEGFGGDYPSSAFSNHKGSTGWCDGGISIVECFTELWDSIYAKRGYGWDINPWVWVIEFERMVANA